MCFTNKFFERASLCNPTNPVFGLQQAEEHKAALEALNQVVRANTALSPNLDTSSLVLPAMRMQTGGAVQSGPPLKVSQLGGASLPTFKTPAMVHMHPQMVEQPMSPEHPREDRRPVQRFDSSVVSQHSLSHSRSSPDPSAGDAHDAASFDSKRQAHFGSPQGFRPLILPHRPRGVQSASVVGHSPNLVLEDGVPVHRPHARIGAVDQLEKQLGFRASSAPLRDRDGPVCQ